MNKIKAFFSNLWNKVKAGLLNCYKSEGFKTVVTSLWCALIGLIIGFLILLCINPQNAGAGMLSTLKNFFVFSSHEARMRYFGQTLAKAAPLLVVSVSIIFAYKAGLFNIGASGQYIISIIAISYLGIIAKLNWFLVMIIAIIAGALWGVITGILKTFFNVNEVISGIMLNWIALYLANGLLTTNTSIWDSSHSQAFKIEQNNPAFLPNIGLDKVFGDNSIVGIGILFALIVMIAIWVLLQKTTFGYQIKATGLNPYAARYAGINEKRNVIIVTAISGAIVGLAASINIQNGFTSWQLTSTVPSLGFDGISAAFLGGLNPIGALFSSYFITHIIDGGSMITDLGYAPQVANIMTSVIIYLSGIVVFVKNIINKQDLKLYNEALSRDQKKGVTK